MTAQKPRIFISYARKDGESFARDLYERLVTIFGADVVWLDRAKMEGGVGWWKQITEALDSAEFMVLIATPAAMSSVVVQKEWRYARQQGICIYPVQVPNAPIQFTSLPHWMSTVHFYDLEKEWETFVRYLGNKCTVSRVAFYGVPDLPVHFVKRPVEFEQIKAQILDYKSGNPVAITTSLIGAGGFGKTTLAAAICHDEDVLTAFDDGVLWITLGENPDLVGILNSLNRVMMGDQRASFQTIDEASSSFKQKLADKAILFVIDDIWDSVHLKPFLQGGKYCARLLTTRFTNVAVDASAKFNVVDEMSEDQCIKVLLADIYPVPVDTTPLITLAKRLGEWALLLDITNSMLREALEMGDTLSGAINYVNSLLDKYGIFGIEKASKNERSRSAEGVLSASFHHLNNEEQAILFELAIFKEDVDIPLTSVMALWDKEFVQVRQYLMRFARFTLIHFNIEQQLIRIHDVIRQVLQNRLAAKNPLFHTHYKLVSNYGDLAELPDDYAWRNIAYHLNEANQLETVSKLILRFAYLQAKLKATDINALIADCDYCSHRNDIGLVKNALKMASHILQDDPNQLSNQIVGRLDGIGSLEQLIIDAIAEHDSRPMLQLLSASLQRASNAGERTLTHSAPVNSIALQGEYLASASDDKSIRVWNWREGKLLYTITEHHDAVNDVIIEGENLLSAARDGRLIVWELKSGKQVRMMDHWVNNGSLYISSMYMSGDFLISGGQAGLVRIWNWRTGEKLQEIILKDTILAVALEHDRAFVGNTEGDIIVYDWKTSQIEYRLSGHSKRITCLYIFDRYLIGASVDDTITIWDWTNKQLVKTLFGHQSTVTDMAIYGDYLVTTSNDTSLIIWNWKSDRLIAKFQPHQDRGLSLAVSDTHIFTASADSTVKVWKWHPDEVTVLEFDRDDQSSFRIDAVAYENNTVIFLLSNGTLNIGSFAPQSSGIVSYNEILALGEIQRKYYSNYQLKIFDNSAAFADRELLEVWDLQSNTRIRQWICPNQMNPIRAIDVIEDFCVLGAGKIIYVLEWHTFQIIKEWQNHAVVIAIASNGEYIFTGELNGLIRVWNRQSGEEIRILQGHTYDVTVVKVDGDYLISASRDNTIRVWNWQTGEQIYLLTGHTKPIEALCVLGYVAMSVSEDNSIKVWNWIEGKYLETFLSDNSPVSICANMTDEIVVIGGIGGYRDRMHLLRPSQDLLKLMRKLL